MDIVAPSIVDKKSLLGKYDGYTIQHNSQDTKACENGTAHCIDTYHENAASGYELLLDSKSSQLSMQ